MFEPGSQVGRYEIQRRLGRGGMGTVFVAHDPVLGRMVAIKVFAGDLDMPDARERFSREARASASLNHPNIVTVYDFGELSSQPFIVMEYVPGDTMANLIRRKVAVSVAEKLRWIEDLCAGAGFAHQMSVVHRDIKPANLMIDRSGRLKILDFGIARMLGIASNTSVMIGTPGYMAPEQITGDPVDHRADQFSIGVVLYELLSYTEPFHGDTLPQITHRIVSQEPTPLEQLVPDASPELIAIVNQALKKNSAQRFKDTDALRLAISRVRREYESDGEWNTPTISPTSVRDSAPGGGNRGTGSSRRRTHPSIGVAQLTPPPDPRRTDREAIARRRTTQVDAALALARTLFEQKQLDEALDACHQALMLDEMHEAALDLEQEIQTAIRVREGVEIAADDPGLASSFEPTVIDPGFASSRLLQSQVVTGYHEDAFAFTGQPAETPERRETKPPVPAPVQTPAPTGLNAPASEETATRIPAAVPAALPAPLPAALPDVTVIAPPRRTPPPVAVNPTASAPPPPAPVVVKAPSALAPPAPSVTAKKNARTQVVDAGRQGTASPSALQTIGQTIASASPLVRVGAGVGVLAVIGVAVKLMTGGGPAATGTTIIDAVPWANIVSITNEDGEGQSLPPAAATPLVLALPAGTYQVTMTGPPPESKREQVSVRVEAGGTALVQPPRFRGLTVDEYFEQYLAAGDAPSSSVPATAAAPPAPADATGGVR